MRFSWQDVKKQVRKRDGEQVVTPHFLRPGELRAEIARLVAFHEQRCGRARKDFAQDEASALIGDYRLANCLLAVLSAWYSWQQPSWAELLHAVSDETFAALDMAGITSSVQLRLALFDYVNAHYGGFLDTETRPVALVDFAALYHLDVARLEYLLALDTDDEAILTRTALAPPEADAVAALYNQWVFEAALFNASEAHFVIDCEAFLEAQRTEMSGALTGIGAVIKRLCYLARKLGVCYDLAYEETLPGMRTTLLHLTLYGPQEMSGSPQQYGQRLARLCRLLLLPGSRGGTKSSVSLNKAIRRAEATVYVFQKACRFTMDGALLALLPAPEPERDAGRVAEASAIYDSSIEQTFAEAFASLERGQGTAGWQLEREPEPLLLDTGVAKGLARGIFIPDFALTRATRRIYIEILGFWTPAYRERKVQKLQQLKGRADLVLAFPTEAREAFAGLAADFPLVEYRGQLSATDLLRMMQERFDDFAERLAALDSEGARTQIRAAGLVPERACYTLLNCYRRSELVQAAARVQIPGEIVYTPGLGLSTLAWLEQLHRSFVDWVEAEQRYALALAEILQKSRVRWPELANCEDAALETLLGLWPEIEIKRSSIFEATLLVKSQSDKEETKLETPIEAEKPVARKVVRERRKKLAQPETSQQNLWE